MSESNQRKKIDTLKFFKQILSIIQAETSTTLAWRWAFTSVVAAAWASSHAQIWQQKAEINVS